MWYTFPPLIILVATIFPILWLKRWITLHLQGLGILLWGDADVAMLLYFLTLLPGIVLHELSHWAFARVLGVRTGRMQLWPSRKGGGRMRLGSVRIGQTDPFRASLIGLAPFITGCLAIYLIGDQILGASTIITPLFRTDFTTFKANLSAYPQASDFWIWIYVIFTISNTMFPSESDRQAWWPVVALLGAMALLGYTFGLLEEIPAVLANAWAELVSYLAYASILTLVVNLASAAVLAITEKIVATIKGTRIAY